MVLAVLLGALVGVGTVTFSYASGLAYLSNDPAACQNCHIMNEQFDSWRKGPHHSFATCNDCHVPPHFPAKYLAKAENGYHHSMAFTLGNYRDVIRARPESSAVVEANCRRCHADLVEGIAHGADVSCVRCHASVGHLR